MVQCTTTERNQQRLKIGRFPKSDGANYRWLRRRRNAHPSPRRRGTSFGIPFIGNHGRRKVPQKRLLSPMTLLRMDSALWIKNVSRRIEIFSKNVSSKNVFMRLYQPHLC